MDIQKRLLDQLRLKLDPEQKLVEVLMEKLHISMDAAYRRINGKVALSVQEAEILVRDYELNFGNLISAPKGSIGVRYQPLTREDIDMRQYLTELRDGLRAIKNLQDPDVTISVNESPIFQYFNFPHLLRFKFFFWSKSYLMLPSHKDQKFQRTKIGKEFMEIGLEAHNLYNSIPSTEIYCAYTLEGVIRQLEFYFEAGFFENPMYVFEMLDNVRDFITHLKRQAEVGHKFSHGSEPNDAKDSRFTIYHLETYIPDNTYFVEHKHGEITFFSHNIMNILSTQDRKYNEDSKWILKMLRDNSINITGDNSIKAREAFFNGLYRKVKKVRKRLEAKIEEEV